MNTAGTRTCGPCPQGFTGDGLNGCVDIDECLSNDGGCDPLTTCTDTPGSRSCGECPEGYTGTGEEGCVQIPPGPVASEPRGLLYAALRPEPPARR